MADDTNIGGLRTKDLVTWAALIGIIYLLSKHQAAPTVAADTACCDTCMTSSQPTWFSGGQPFTIEGLS